MRHALSLMVAGLACCLGCSRVAPYAADRARDLLDCFKLEAGVGGVADIEVRATDWACTGLGAAGSFRWGFDGRRPVGFPGAADSGVTHHYGFPVMPLRSWLSLEDYESDGAIRHLYTDLWVRDRRFFSPEYAPARVDKSIVFYALTSQPSFREPGDERRPLHAYDIHLGATLLGSLRVGVSPGEMADFLLGWFGRDIGGDDASSRPAANGACAPPAAPVK
ncbi:hypothetical protein HQ576_17795 [bacterium]|nr:hypothetical protein [bacterium]